ncbi:MAG: DUF2842 domain-containing protein [Alphaproteobacteria bacterium]|nr:DUF2842 domain-containing protein [Alphaproteobacteria bacterium]
MRPSWRNTVGIAVLVLGLAVYALVVMVIGASMVPDHALVQLVFFAVAGLAWLWPARGLLRWMARGAPDAP